MAGSLKSQKYVPDEDDALDLKMAEYINRPNSVVSQLNLDIKRVQLNLYQIGPQKILEVRQSKDKLVVKVGGGFISLNEFILEYYDKKRHLKLEINNEETNESGGGFYQGIKTERIYTPQSNSQ